jgi:2-alkenal reductase
MTPKRLLIPLAAFLAAFASLSPLAQKSEAYQPRAVAPRGPLLPQEQAIVGMFEATAPSVAYIFTQRVARVNFLESEVSTGAGSGFVWDKEGHIVTNFHVLQGATSVNVQLDAGKAIPAKVVGVAQDYDLAVVKLTQVPKDLRPIPLGSSRDLKIGQITYAIGNPFGMTRTLTQGIVSALDRQLSTSGFREIGGAIQTDAAINPGNSGGPLVDSVGRLIGVNTQIRGAAAQSSGVGLAIPVDLVNRVVPALIARGRAPQPGIGIGIVNPALAARNGIRGIVVDEAPKGRPAEKAGIRGIKRLDGNRVQIGDVIVAVNGRPVHTLPSFVSEIDRVGIDNTAELTVVRDGKERKVPVKIVDLEAR